MARFTHSHDIQLRPKVASRKNTREILLITFLALSFFLAVFLSLEIFVGVKGSGIVLRDDYTDFEYDTVVINEDFDVLFVESRDEAFIVEAEDNILDLIEVREDGGSLYVEYKENWLGRKKYVDNRSPITIRISEDSLRKLVHNGKGKISTRSLSHEALEIETNNEVTIDLRNILFNQLSFSLKDNATVYLQGETLDQIISLSGDVQFDGSDLTSETTTISGNGEGSLFINVTEVLSVDADGSQVIEYVGEPEVLDNSSDSVIVEALEAAKNSE